jgi:uncharacterized protein (DUF58 family)
MQNASTITIWPFGNEPSLSRFVSKASTPLGVLLAGAIAAFLGGLFVAPQGFAVLAAILAVVVIGAAWPWIALRGVECTITFTARRGREGQPTPMAIVVVNRWPLPVWGLAIEGAVSDTSGHGDTVTLARLGGWSRTTFRCTLTPPCRGVYPRHVPQIVTGFPFGVYRAAKRARVERRLTVWPETCQLASRRPSSAARSLDTDNSPAGVGLIGTRCGVREFRHGDNLRDIHWSKSASSDRLLVSERECDRSDRAVVRVESDIAHSAGCGCDSSLEWSLRIAASLCESIVIHRGQVELWLGDGADAIDSGSVGLDGLLDAIALFPGHSRAAHSSRPKRRRASTVEAAYSIGSGPSKHSGVKSIVLCPAGFGSHALAPADPTACWLVLSSPRDAYTQLRAAWRRTGRRAVYAN